MKEEILYDLIVRCLSGEASHKDIAIVEQWRHSSAENEQAFHEMKSLWGQSSVEQPAFEVDTEQALLSVSARLTRKQATRTVRLSPSLWIKAAAVFVVLVASSLVLSLLFKDGRHTLVAGAADEVTMITLTDGTRVWINKHSELTYPTNFDDTIRLVKLEGEAYFEVAKNPHKPFIIEAGGAQTRVLGTAFNLRARKGEREVSVSVHEGRVAFYDETKKVILTPGEVGVLDRETGQLSESLATNANDVAWKTGTLRFRHTKLEDVAHQLSDMYNVSVRLDASIPDTVQFNGEFHDKTLDTVLRTIEFATNLKVVKQEKGYLIK